MSKNTKGSEKQTPTRKAGSGNRKERSEPWYVEPVSPVKDEDVELLLYFAENAMNHIGDSKGENVIDPSLATIEVQECGKGKKVMEISHTEPEFALLSSGKEKDMEISQVAISKKSVNFDSKGKQVKEDSKISLSKLRSSTQVKGKGKKVIEDCGMNLLTGLEMESFNNAKEKKVKEPKISPSSMEVVGKGKQVVDQYAFTKPGNTKNAQGPLSREGKQVCGDGMKMKDFLSIFKNPRLGGLCLTKSIMGLAEQLILMEIAEQSESLSERQKLLEDKDKVSQEMQRLFSLVFERQQVVISNSEEFEYMIQHVAVNIRFLCVGFLDEMEREELAKRAQNLGYLLTFGDY